MNNYQWKKNLSEALPSLIGHEIRVDNIHSDNNGWYYYIPAKSLQRNRPLIMFHYRMGTLFVIIPHEDYELLENGEISVEKYISSSVWNYGYHAPWSYWQPIEGDETCGIHDTAKIKQYLSILKSRLLNNSCGNEEYLPEPDDRTHFIQALSARIKEQFGFETEFAIPGDGEKVLLTPICDRNKVSVTYPKEIMADLLYHPGKFDTFKLANSLKYELCIWDGNATITSALPEDADSNFCYQILWRFPQYRCWFSLKEKLHLFAESFLK